MANRIIHCWNGERIKVTVKSFKHLQKLGLIDSKQRGNRKAYETETTFAYILANKIPYMLLN